MTQIQYRGKRLLERQGLPGGERIGKEFHIQRRLCRRQRSLSQGAHRPGNRIMDLCSISRG